MIHGVLTAVWEKARVFMPFSTRWAEGPIDDADSLAKFVGGRGAFVAQTSLYGYVRTRAGTRYTALLEDAPFAVSLNMAKWRLFIACVEDLATYSVAYVGRESRATEEELSLLAGWVWRQALGPYGVPADADAGWIEAARSAAARVEAADWRAHDDMESAFANSPEALLSWAPIADELKALDREIVTNSIRFKWRDVRQDFRKRAVADAILADFRAKAAGGA